jgi:hypothetical protein
MVKKNKKTLVFAVVIVCAILVLSLVGTYPTFLKEESYPMDVTSGDFAGFNLNHDKIHFGIIHPGTFSKRDFQLYNSAEYSVKAKLGCEGEICDLIFFESNNLIINANSNSTVYVTVNMPSDAELNKTFEGNLTVQFYKRLF